jgi:hypothetical protein
MTFDLLYIPVSSYNSSKLDQVSTWLAKESTRGTKCMAISLYKKIYISRPTNVVYIYLTVSIKVYPDTWTKIIYLLWDVELEQNSEIFWFPKYRQDARHCIQIVDYKGLALSKNF